ncbi:hypothetical protein D3C86_2178890 [compost metagenome]
MFRRQNGAQEIAAEEDDRHEDDHEQQWQKKDHAGSCATAQLKTIAVPCAMLSRADSYRSSHDSISR